ncbi:hypothetical protein K491DRAFT_721995 [Lophiostoma macrostomum CBS 122681]|uniref:Uncharacterized protein n=1 Tax=Lophiostoma macrostomum CBS 122681 TaxID=1314788 RepID=A0A6A6SQ17_9PLEO|nr:hypothetical protein K491DRAFT_721995 [Lophiostoma macrostomum CBS 122681]
MFMWEGEDRAKTNAGRCLPLLHKLYAPGITWAQLQVVEQYELDQVARIPDMEDVYLPVDEIDDEIKPCVVGKDSLFHGTSHAKMTDKPYSIGIGHWYLGTASMSSPVQDTTIWMHLCSWYSGHPWNSSNCFVETLKQSKWRDDAAIARHKDSLTSVAIIDEEFPAPLLLFPAPQYPIISSMYESRDRSMRSSSLKDVPWNHELGLST